MNAKLRQTVTADSGPPAGLDAGTVRQVKMQAACAMLLDVQQLVDTGGSVNQCNDEGVTLVSVPPSAPACSHGTGAFL